VEGNNDEFLSRVTKNFHILSSNNDKYIGLPGFEIPRNTYDEIANLDNTATGAGKCNYNIDSTADLQPNYQIENAFYSTFIQNTRDHPDTGDHSISQFHTYAYGYT
jgi:hypothetical protein